MKDKLESRIIDDKLTRGEKIEAAAAALLAMQRHSWEQGTALQAFAERGDYDTLVRLCLESVYRASDDGRPATIGVNDGGVDPCSIGGPLLQAIRFLEKRAETGKDVDEENEVNEVNDAKSTIDAKQTQKGSTCSGSGNNAYPIGYGLLVKGAKDLERWALELAPRNAQGIVYHLTTGTQFWSDSINMMPPYLAEAGHLDLAIQHLDAYWAGLYDEEAGLLCHIYNDASKKMDDPDHWGVGNGWALMGLVRVAALLGDDPAYAEDVRRFKERTIALVDRIWSLRDSEGRLHNILDDPSSFEEVGIASMTAYAIYRAAKLGWMDESYLAKADALRAYVESKQDAYGFIWDVCGAPTFDKPGIAPEQQAAFILMENAADLVKDSMV